MSQAPDFVRIVLAMVQEIQPAFTAEQSAQTEQHIRQDWGGKRPYIAAHAPAMREAREKVRQQIGVRPIAEIISEHGIARSTLYRWIKK